jgi:hypothetical protein
MNFDASPNPELDELLEHLLEDSLSTEEAARLNFLLLNDSQARDRYLLYMELHGSLLYDQIATGSLELDPQPASSGMNETMILPAMKDEADEPAEYGEVDEPAARFAKLPKRSRWLLSGPVWISVAASVLLALGALVFFNWHSKPILVATIDATWDGAQDLPQLGKPMPSGEVQLDSGLARIKFPSGVEVIVEAPARLQADQVNGISLLSGKLTAEVPRAGHGFTVKCPDATVVDLGTEFGINLHGDGSTDVDVFKGTITLAPGTPQAADAGAASHPLTLTAGSARQVSVDQTVTPIASNAGGYVRRDDFEQMLGAPDSQSLVRWRVYSDTLRENPDLVAYYTFERSADSGRLVNHSSVGASLDGTLVAGKSDGGPQWSTGRWPGKGALTFQPTSTQHVSLPDSPAIDFSRNGGQSSPFTICAWVRPAPFGGKASGAIICRGHGRHEQYTLDLIDGDIRTWVRSTNDLSDRPGMQIKLADLASWHLVVSDYDAANGKLRLYVDGKLAREKSVTRDLLAIGDINIGSRRDQSPQFDSTFTGSIDELAIFKKPLTSDQVLDMYNAGKPD